MKWRNATPYFVLLVPTLLVFGNVLLSPGQWVASHRQYDVAAYYAPVRDFGFGEMRSGHVPLWNPYTFSGTPFVAGFQSALFYPLNLHYLVLPLSPSLNIEIVLHVYLIGAFMYAWARGRGLSTVASLFAAVVVQYSGPYYLNVLAGHLSYLGALAWTPLAFLAVDKAVYKCRIQWAFVGAMALTMSILAGHPQAVFCTVVVLVPYALVGVAQSRRRANSFGYLTLILVAPLLLSAAQLWPAIALAKEGIRAGGLHYVLASSLSFPPENLLSLFAPSLFGDSVTGPYTGRWVFWETCAFMGIGALSLAAYAVVANGRRERIVWLSLALMAALIALGRYTPIYYLLYTVVPGIDSFRCPSRQFFHATMFLALLSGLGLDTLLRAPIRTKKFAAVMAIACTAFAAAAAYLYVSNVGGQSALWGRVLAALHVPSEVRWQMDDIKVGLSCAHAARSLAIAAFTCAVLAALYVTAGIRRRAAYAIAAVGAVELLVFALAYRASADLSTRRKPDLVAQLHAGQRDARVFDMAIENYPLEIRRHDMWGYDSTALLRYAELIAYTQDTRAEYELTEFTFKWFHPLYAMMRCQFVIDSRKDAGQLVHAFADPLPRALLIDTYSVVPDKEERFEILADVAFRPREHVILETEPNPAPVDGGAMGSVQVRDETTDSFVVEVEARQSAILLITDSYAFDWRATSVGPSPQPRYDIMPANHALRAIPIKAGTHRIRMQYAPAAARWGVRVALFSNALFVAFWFLCIRGTLGKRVQ